jgi:hypothetical protein
MLLSATSAANVKVFAKSFRQRIKYYIFDALTKAFCVILLCGPDIADKRAFRGLETSEFNTSSTD